MRVADRPIPTFTPTHPGLMDWPVDIHLIVETQNTNERWDQPGIYWDDPQVKWDQPQLPGAFDDITCDLAGVDIEHGPPDELYLFPAGSMRATLIDPDGRYTRYNPDGTLTTWQVGKRIGIVADDGQTWWLFFGRITNWSDFGDGTVEIEAFNIPNELGPVGTFTPGANGDKPNTRILAIANIAKTFDEVYRFDAGTVALTAQATTRSPLEEMQAVTLSDAGILFADADDGLVYRDRNWRAGRSDQRNLWIYSDDVCTADAVVWGIRLDTGDADLVTEVTLTNVAGLTARKTNDPNPYFYSSPYTHPQPDQWTTQAEGDAVAQNTLDNRKIVHVAVDEFTLYIHDTDQDLWPMAVDTRIGDRFLFLHNYAVVGGGTNQFALGAIVNTIRISINPHEWLMTLGAWTYILPLATTALAGEPGRYVDAAGQPAQIPQTFAELITIGADPIGWRNGEYVALGDGTEAWHNVDGWHTGRAPTIIGSHWHTDARWSAAVWSSLLEFDYDETDPTLATASVYDGDGMYS